MITIRTIFNLAISRSKAEAKFYPFGKGKYQIKFPETQKIGLTIDEIIILENLQGLSFLRIVRYQHGYLVFILQELDLVMFFN